MYRAKIHKNLLLSGMKLIERKFYDTELLESRAQALLFSTVPFVTQAEV